MDTKLDILVRAGTGVIADVIDNMGLLPLVLDNSLRPAGQQVQARFAGPAYTVAGEAGLRTDYGDRAKLAAIDQMPAGVVALWAGKDISRGVACFGDLLVAAMKVRGCKGVIVDGGVKDTALTTSYGIPVIARYSSPASSLRRWRVIGHQISVQVRGALEDKVNVNPGDIIVNDDDGIMIVPANLLDEVVQRVIMWEESDSEARKEILQGMTLLEAIDKYGHL